MIRKGLALMAVLLAWSCVGPFSEDLESHYENVSGARADGAFVRGWLPEIVPDDATDIWELHNLDTNQTWACFRTPGGADEVRRLILRGGWTRVTGTVHTGPPRLFRARPWWPESMRNAPLETYELAEESGHVIVVGIDERAAIACLYRR